MARAHGRGGPGGSRRPGVPARSRPGSPSRERLERTGDGPAVAGPATGEQAAVRQRRRPRLTGRAAVLLVVVAMLMASYASSLKAYLHQREDISALKSEIAEREAAIQSLQQEKRRWEDPAYTAQQARERMGYVLPGQRSYVVVDENGDPIQGGAALDDPDEVVRVAPTPWWDNAWASLELAGHPPKEKPQDQTVPKDMIGK